MQFERGVKAMKKDNSVYVITVILLLTAVSMLVYMRFVNRSVQTYDGTFVDNNSVKVAFTNDNIDRAQFAFSSREFSYLQ